MYYKNLYRKEMIKNIIIIGIILFIAVFSTYNIYYAFNDTKEIDYSSTSLDVTFHEENGEELDITKITPLRDNVALSSADSHAVTITNNLTESVNYKIKIVDNLEKISEQNCDGITIPREEIRISIKAPGKKTKIYSLSEIEDGVLLSHQAKPLEESKYTIRLWVKDETNINGSDYHYHGLIQVIENDTTLAVK